MKRFGFFAIAMVLALGLAGCTPAVGNGGGVTGFAANVVTVGDISTATTWSASKVYYIDTSVYVSAALTIPAGTVVKFATYGELVIQTGGQLNAVGDALSHIVFTSIKDDSAGGDSNLDGTASSPAKNDYNDTLIHGNSSTVDYCEFRYAGTGLYVDANSVKVTNSIFANNGVSSTSGFGLDVSHAGSTFTMNNNTFYGNYRPLAIGFSQPVDSTSVFHSGSLVNKYPGIWVGSDLATSVTQSNTEVAYVLPDTTTYINTGITLTLTSGVCFKFAGVYGELHVNSGGFINPTTLATFTSIKDDSVKGDTNGDGTASTPASADWVGLYDANITGYRATSGSYVINYSYY